MAETADLTLEEIRLALAPSIAQAAVFDGWSAEALESASRELDIDPDVAAYAFKGGAIAMIDAWIGHVDEVMAAELTPEALTQMKVRDRIIALVLVRLDAIEGMEEALRRALAIMAMPQNAARSLKRGWQSADLMWRMAGDTATDYSHYSKRAILSTIYAATLAVFAEDESEGKRDTRAFLDRRIDGVMRFEKAKAQLLRGPEDRFSIARFLGRLRYPAQ